jgi:hypothetical protein
MAKKFLWKIWLRINALTKSVDNDYVAEISTVGNTLRNEDIARLIVEGRSELHYETILNIINERDTIERNALLKGSSVQSRNLHVAPRVLGSWSAYQLFDSKKHKITLDAAPTAEMRKTLESVGVKVLGTKTDGGAIIGLVTDVLTGKTDGTITVGGDIIITGKKIKIAPAGEEGLGVFFVDTDGTEIPLDRPVAENNPKKIICRLPAQVTDGVYVLKIVTRFTSSPKLLNEPRTVLYGFLLTIVTVQA